MELNGDIMETRNILVTGGTGFIGRWISKLLVENGHNVYIADDLSGSTIYNIDEFYYNLAGFCHIDLSDSIKTRNMIEKIKPEIIYHVASSAREGASFFDPVKITKTNYMSYINTLEPAIKTGQLDKVILFSSMAVYGNQIPPFNENMERRPVDLYGINKTAMEHTTELLSDVHNFDYVIIRPHNVWGPFQSMRDKYRNVVMIMINKILRKEPIIIYGDGNQQRAFSYIDNSIDCYIKAMDEKCNGDIINVGGKIPVTINRLTELVCNAMGVDNYPVEHVPDRHGEVKIAWCTTNKSEKLLGYKENVSTEEGMKTTADWAKSKGPQEWTTEKLALFNDKCPKWWN